MSKITLDNSYVVGVITTANTQDEYNKKTNVVKKWCTDRNIDYYAGAYGGYVLWYHLFNERDAMLFKLTWCDYKSYKLIDNKIVD